MEPRKECFRCHRLLPLEDFYVHKEMKDGHLNKCKDCTKKDVAIRARRDFEKIQKYERSRQNLPHRIESRRRAFEKYKKEHPERNAICLKVQRAIKAGKITRPSTCSICGKKGRIVAHHADYSKPLDVIFVCQCCHKRIHAGTL